MLPDIGRCLICKICKGFWMWPQWFHHPSTSFSKMYLYVWKYIWLLNWSLSVNDPVGESVESQKLLPLLVFYVVMFCKMLWILWFQLHYKEIDIYNYLTSIFKMLSLSWYLRVKQHPSPVLSAPPSIIHTFLFTFSYHLSH